MAYVYRNKNTGATFTTTCKCSGKNWEQVKGEKAKVQKPEVIEQVDEAEVAEQKKKA